MKVLICLAALVVYVASQAAQEHCMDDAWCADTNKSHTVCSHPDYKPHCYFGAFGTPDHHCGCSTPHIDNKACTTTSDCQGDCEATHLFHGHTTFLHQEHCSRGTCHCWAAPWGGIGTLG